MVTNDPLHLSVDCVVFGYNDTGLKVLLINQKETKEDHSSQPMSQLPGDLILLDEGLEEAAERVLFELTQLRGVYLKQFSNFR